MQNQDLWAERFEAHRGRLNAVAYRMLGSLTEAEDAVQEAWIRLSRSDADEVENLGGWLTTVVGRVCLDQLRSRQSRGEVHLPDPVVSPADGVDPEQEALIADSVGLALQVVLESLRPAERLVFVLHDMFGVPFEEIGRIVQRSPAAAKQLASRARGRVRGAAPVGDPDPHRQREVVDAFMAAARGGDLAALVAVLDPDVVVRADRGTGALVEIRGAAEVAGQALGFAHLAGEARAVLVNGAPGILGRRDGQPQALLSFTITDGRIVAIQILADRERLRRLDIDAP
jgi:RNA polymerase sigma-70 factor, ECF subfamily